MKTAITGGIGSGKSYVCRLLVGQGICVYDCDTHAKRLMVESEEIRRQLTALIGPEAYLPTSPNDQTPNSQLLTPNSQLLTPNSKLLTPNSFRLNKPVIARFLMASEENAKALEHIVHPAVINDFLESGMEWMESAILFESGFNHFVDRVVVVTAPEELRIVRVMERDGISREKALEWINRQLPQDYLIAHANHVIVNDGCQPLLPQLEALIPLL